MPRVSKAKAAVVEDEAKEAGVQSTKKSAAAKKASAEQSVDFEAGIAELEAIVQAMESGDMSLEESLNAFERGMALSSGCQKALADAELKIQTLSERAALAAEE